MAESMTFPDISECGSQHLLGICGGVGGLAGSETAGLAAAPYHVRRCSGCAVLRLLPLSCSPWGIRPACSLSAVQNTAQGQNVAQQSPCTTGQLEAQ